MSWVLLGSLRRSHYRGLLLGLFLGGLLGSVSDDNRWLGCFLASDVVRINVRRRTNKTTTFYQCQKSQKKQMGGSAEVRL